MRAGSSAQNKRARPVPARPDTPAPHRRDRTPPHTTAFSRRFPRRPGRPSREGPRCGSALGVGADSSRRRGPAPAALPARQPGAAAHPTGRRAGAPRRRPAGQWPRAWGVRTTCALTPRGRQAHRAPRNGGREAQVRFAHPLRPSAPRLPAPPGRAGEAAATGARARRGTGSPRGERCEAAPPNPRRGNGRAQERGGSAAGPALSLTLVEAAAALADILFPSLPRSRASVCAPATTQAGGEKLPATARASRSCPNKHPRARGEEEEEGGGEGAGTGEEGERKRNGSEGSSLIKVRCLSRGSGAWHPAVGPGPAEPARAAAAGARRAGAAPLPLPARPLSARAARLPPTRPPPRAFSPAQPLTCLTAGTVHPARGGSAPPRSAAASLPDGPGPPERRRKGGGGVVAPGPAAPAGRLAAWGRPQASPAAGLPRAMVGAVGSGGGGRAAAGRAQPMGERGAV